MRAKLSSILCRFQSSHNVICGGTFGAMVLSGCAPMRGPDSLIVKPFAYVTQAMSGKNYMSHCFLYRKRICLSVRSTDLLPLSCILSTSSCQNTGRWCGVRLRVTVKAPPTARRTVRAATRLCPEAHHNHQDSRNASMRTNHTTSAREQIRQLIIAF